jgi:hypothetical protein
VTQTDDEEWTEEYEIDDDDAHIYPLPKGTTEVTLEKYAEISAWQYFPFSFKKGYTRHVGPVTGGRAR